MLFEVSREHTGHSLVAKYSLAEGLHLVYLLRLEFFMHPLGPAVEEGTGIFNTRVNGELLKLGSGLATGSNFSRSRSEWTFGLDSASSDIRFR